MTSSAAFRKPPQPENLSTLFEIQRILTFYSDIGMALPSCARQLSKALPPCEVLISLSLESGKAFDQATILPETSRGKYRNLAMEMGKAPFGLAVENEALSLGQIEADRLRLMGGQQPQEALFVIEAPVFSSSPKGDADRKISGALCVILDATPSDEQRHRAADLVQLSCYLIEEASSLRDSLA